MYSIPVVAITANVDTGLLGKSAFQEVNITSITSAVTKKNYLVTDVKKLAPTIREAFRIAMSGRKGPVLIDIPKDVTAAETEYEPAAETDAALRGGHPETADGFPGSKKTANRSIVENTAVQRTADRIARAERPFILVGGGCVRANACPEVREFAAKIQAPVCDTLMGKGVFPGDDPLYTGMLGMHGTKASDVGSTVL